MERVHICIFKEAFTDAESNSILIIESSRMFFKRKPFCSIGLVPEKFEITDEQYKRIYVTKRQFYKGILGK